MPRSSRRWVYCAIAAFRSMFALSAAPTFPVGSRRAYLASKRPSPRYHADSARDSRVLHMFTTYTPATHGSTAHPRWYYAQTLVQPSVVPAKAPKAALLLPRLLEAACGFGPSASVHAGAHGRHANPWIYAIPGSSMLPNSNDPRRDLGGNTRGEYRFGIVFQFRPHP